MTALNVAWDYGVPMSCLVACGDDADTPDEIYTFASNMYVDDYYV